MTTPTGGNPTVNWLVRFWPIIVVVVVISGAAYTAQFRINVLAAEVVELEGDIDDNSDDIEQLRLDQIRAEGANALSLQQLQSDMDGIGSKIDLLIQFQRQRAE